MVKWSNGSLCQLPSFYSQRWESQTAQPNRKKIHFPPILSCTWYPNPYPCPPEKSLAWLGNWGVGTAAVIAVAHWSVPVSVFLFSGSTMFDSGIASRTPIAIDWSCKSQPLDHAFGTPWPTELEHDRNYAQRNTKIILRNHKTSCIYFKKPEKVFKSIWTDILYEIALLGIK